jgi:hypothetical protein
MAPEQAGDIAMPSEWYEGTVHKLEELKQKLLPREVKEYQLDKLQRLSLRFDEFATGDEACRRYQQVVDGMLTELEKAPLPNDRNKIYLCTIGDMVSHLKKAHHMVNDGEYLGLWLAFGLVLGSIAGLISGISPWAPAWGCWRTYYRPAA